MGGLSGTDYLDEQGNIRSNHLGNTGGEGTEDEAGGGGGAEGHEEEGEEEGG